MVDISGVVEGVCDADDIALIRKQEEVRGRVVESIVTDFAPEIVSVSRSTLFNSSIGSDNIRAVYNVLANKLEVNQSEIKFNNFVEAITEIAAAEEEACSGSDIYSLSVSDIPGIVAEFNTAFSAGRDSDITTIRALYGQMLCIKHQESLSKRRKRWSDYCDTMTDCKCPEGGLHGTKILCPCHFFRCLDPDNHLKPIFGFSENGSSFQCLAFVIDTTGSMREEISGAQNIIKEFIRAEEYVGFAGCYLLVPFNDVGLAEESKMCWVIHSLHTSIISNLLFVYCIIDYACYFVFAQVLNLSP